MALPGSSSSSSSSSSSAPSSMASRALLFHRAKVAQIAGRVDDVVKAMHALSELCVDLREEEHNLLVAAYCQYVYPKHSSLAALLAIEVGENNAAFLEETKICRKSLQSELRNFFSGAIAHLKKYLIPSSLVPENRVFYHKLEGDFFWLLGELQPGSDRNLSYGNSLKAYKLAQEQAERNLPPANRTRLLVAYKHSILYYYMAGCQRSLEIAEAALGQALVSVGTLSEDLCSDSKMLLELLKEIVIIASVEYAIKTGMNELMNESEEAPVSKSAEELVEQSSAVVRCFSTPYEQGPPAPVQRIAVPPVKVHTFVSPPAYIPAQSTKEIRSRRKASACRRGHMG